MKILLATDGSEHSVAAVDETVRQRSPNDCEVRVISVIEPIAYPSDGMTANVYEEIEKIASERATLAVEKAVAELRAGDQNHKLKITTGILSGSPKGVIIEEAEAFGADLIVVGSHGHGMVERLLLGSVSQAVALHATCSVEIVRSRKTSTSEVSRGGEEPRK